MSKEQWTKQCNDGRACAPVDWKAVQSLGKRDQKLLVKSGWEGYRLDDQRYFIPDEYDICDACLERLYGLEARHDQCDQIGLGPEYYEREVVLAALREARKGKPV